jgi:VanZ family protein
VKKVTSVFYFWLPAVVYMGVIFYLSSFSQSDTSFPLPDYVLHMGEYFLLSLLLIRAVRKGLFQPETAFEWFMGIVFPFFYGILDEIHQYFVPGRTADIRDVLLDLIGATLGYLFILFIHPLWIRIRRRKSSF